MIKVKIGEIDGQRLTNVSTLKSGYDNNCIVFGDDNNKVYYMDVKEIFKFDTDFNSLVFYVLENKNHKKYLEVKQ